MSRRAKGRRAGRGSAANWGIAGGGGVNIFFRGRNVHQVVLEELEVTFGKNWSFEINIRALLSFRQVHLEVGGPSVILSVLLKPNIVLDRPLCLSHSLPTCFDRPILVIRWQQHAPENTPQNTKIDSSENF